MKALFGSCPPMKAGNFVGQTSAELTTQMSLDRELQASTIVLTFSDVGLVVSTSTL